jgi:C-terminal processing protease CtpA/Prc
LVVSIKYRNKSEEKYFSDKFTKKEKFKIIVLINESSASASEITTL